MNTDFGCVHPAFLTAASLPVADASTTSQATRNRLSDLPSDLIRKIVSLTGKVDRIALASSMLLGKVTVQTVSRREQAKLREEVEPFIDEIISKLDVKVDTTQIAQLRDIFNQERTPLLDQKTRIATLKNRVVNILFGTFFSRMSLSKLVAEFNRFPPSLNGLFETLVAKEEERLAAFRQAELALEFGSAYLKADTEFMRVDVRVDNFRY